MRAGLGARNAICEAGARSANGAQTSQPRATPHGHLVKRYRALRGWMTSLRAPCVSTAEGPFLRVALSRGLWHGARSDAIHHQPFLRSTAKLNGRGATPWVWPGRGFSPERAADFATPFQGFGTFAFNPGRCPRLACFGAFGPLRPR